MRYADFEEVMSVARMSRYRSGTSTTKKAMTLYRLNLKASQELFTIICCFEVAIRNKINKQAINTLGNDWLLNGAVPGGIFDNHNCRYTRQIINDAVNKLGNSYTHSKLVAEIGFGFWRFMFAPHQFTAMGRTLLCIFPAKPISTPAMSYNQKYVFNQLAMINDLRNRIAHHEPICFVSGQPIKNTSYIRQHYDIIIKLFRWMDIDESSLLYGLDHVETVCDQIDSL